MPPGEEYRPIIRELLVRYLDGCAPPLLHSARRLTYAELGSPGAQPSAVAALAALGEFPDLLARRGVRLVLAGADPAGQQAVRDASAALGPAVELIFADPPLLAALRAAGSFGAPILAFLDPPADGSAFPQPPGAAVPASRGRPEPAAPDPSGADGLAELLAALAGNPGSDVLAILDGAADPDTCRTAGFKESVTVGLTAVGASDRLLLFGSNTARHLDAVKDALWAADEYAGVRYRDPADPDRTALDISLAPNLGPLRRLLLARLRSGPRSLGELRGYTRAETIYRPAEAARAVTALLRAGQLDREPEHGRLAADTLLRTR